MANNVRGGRQADPNGLALMLGDSQTAANNFGMTGNVFANVPKNKFLFWIKFHRPQAAGGEKWDRSVGTQIKSVDRPRVQFQQQTLNQYNRKRIVQTGHEFEQVQIKFHDAVDPAIRALFVEYYQFYYGDSKIYGAGSSAATVYDVVTGENDRSGQWGFRPPLEDQNYAYFFSHISIYQFYNGYMERFDLINPKIASYNPDDFDYSVGAVVNEIVMNIEFEGIVFAEPEPVTADILSEAGLDLGNYWDVPVETSLDFQPGSALGPNAITSSFGDVSENVLRQNFNSLITGQGTQGLGGIVSSIAGAYDANRGLAIGKTAANSLKNLVSGNTGAAKQGVQGLLKGALFGKPGKLF